MTSVLRSSPAVPMLTSFTIQATLSPLTDQRAGNYPLGPAPPILRRFLREFLISLDMQTRPPRRVLRFKPKWRGWGRPPTKAADKGHTTGAAIDARIGSKDCANGVNGTHGISQQGNAFRPEPARSAESSSSEARIPNAVSFTQS